MQPIALEARVQLAVPPARGMGSSATAIVAGLMGANALAGEALGKEKLLELSQQPLQNKMMQAQGIQ